MVFYHSSSDNYNRRLINKDGPKIADAVVFYSI